jgi:hypothetical protein
MGEPLTGSPRISVTLSQSPALNRVSVCCSARESDVHLRGIRSNGPLGVFGLTDATSNSGRSAEDCPLETEANIAVAAIARAVLTIDVLPKG